VQGNQIAITGPDAARCCGLFDELVLVLESGQALDTTKIAPTIDMVEDDLRPSEVLAPRSRARARARRASLDGRPEALHRRHRLIDHHLRHRVRPVLAVQELPIAVAQAVQALHRRQVQRIVLTRPAVEAGEHLGFCR